MAKNVNPQLQEFAILRARGGPDGKELALQECADKLGVSLRAVQGWSTKPEVKQYLADYRARVADQLAKKEADSFGDLQLSRNALFAKLLAIADTPAADTNGTLTAQVKAISELCDRMGYTAENAPKPADADKPTGPDVYRSAWNQPASAQ